MVAVVAGLHDVAVVGEAVEQRRHHLSVPEYAAPFREAQVGGDDDAGALVEFADEVEQQGTSGLAERQIAQLIEDHQIGVYHACRELPLFGCRLFQLQHVHQPDGREVADAAVLVLYFGSTNLVGEVLLDGVAGEPRPGGSVFSAPQHEERPKKSLGADALGLREATGRKIGYINHGL